MCESGVWEKEGKKKKKRVKSREWQVPLRGMRYWVPPFEAILPPESLLPILVSHWIKKIIMMKNKVFAPAPLFGRVWDRKRLISKTLYGPRICAKVKFEKKKKKKKKNKYKASLESIQWVILPSSIVSITIPCLNFSIINFLDLLIGVCIIKKRWIIIDLVTSLWKYCEADE